MIDHVFIQAKPGTPNPLTENTFAVWFGCQQLGIETRMFETFEDLVPTLTPATVVAGGVGTVKRALAHLGLPTPPVLDVPDELYPWFGRRIWQTTLGDARARYEQGPFFIKPLLDQKAFAGHLVGPTFRTLLQAAGCPDDMPIWMSEVVNFVTEYRVMVHRGEMIEGRHYKGDFKIAPDYGKAQEAVSAYTRAPIAYSLDVGVTDDGRTLIVEVNDAFSLGSYGTPPIAYTRMVLDRWEEMTSP